MNPDGWPRPKGYANGMAAARECKRFPTMAPIQISDRLLDRAKVEIPALTVLPPREAA